MTDYSNTYTTVKQMIEWLSKFPEDEIIYLGSWNVLFGGGSFKIEAVLIDIRDDVKKTTGKGIRQYKDMEELKKHYIALEAMPSQQVKQIEEFIKDNQDDWNEQKLKKECSKLEELKKQNDEDFVMGKRVPVIFINN